MDSATITRQEGKPWTMQEAADYLGVSYNFLWLRVKAKEILSIRLGRLVKLPDAEVKRLANNGFYSDHHDGLSLA
jgi:excisionase family DNA binding protein